MQIVDNVSCSHPPLWTASDQHFGNYLQDIALSKPAKPITQQHLWSLCMNPHDCLVVQAKLVSQISGMLSSFAQQKTQEVSRTVASLQSQLATGRNAIGGSFSELHNLSAATAGHVQVCRGFEYPVKHCTQPKVPALSLLQMSTCCCLLCCCT